MDIVSSSAQRVALNFLTSLNAHYLKMSSCLGIGIRALSGTFNFCTSFIPLWKSRLLSLYTYPFDWIRNHITSLSRSVISLPRKLWDRYRGYSTYATPDEEQNYWESSSMWKTVLQRSDSRFAGLKNQDFVPPVVLSYSPSLLPEYREKSKRNKDLDFEYYISAGTYLKWHIMVFPHRKHPTSLEASKLRDRWSPRDRQEIHRISRMLSDEVVFSAKNKKKCQWGMKYHRMWEKWLATKEEEVWVVFE